MTPPGLLELVGSRSYALVLPPPARQALLDKVQDLVAGHADLAGRDHFEMPYLTSCWRYRLPA